MTTREPQLMHSGGNPPLELRRQPAPSWLAVLVILLATVAIGLSWRLVNTSPAAEPPPDGRASLAVDALTPTPTAGPTELPPAPAAQPTATPPPAEPTAAQSTAPASQQPEAALSLPTVTPTPELAGIAPRNAQIGGSTTLRLALSGQDFASTGQPLRFSIDTRTHALDGRKLAATDAWCMQLGLAHLYFDLSLHLNPETEELDATGRIDLRSDFCEAPGPLLDSVEIDVAAPSGATAKIAYNLRGERAFFGDTNLLNSDVGVIVDLEITNPRPR